MRLLVALESASLVGAVRWPLASCVTSAQLCSLSGPLDSHLEVGLSKQSLPYRVVWRTGKVMHCIEHAMSASCILRQSSAESESIGHSFIEHIFMSAYHILMVPGDGKITGTRRESFSSWS